MTLPVELKNVPELTIHVYEVSTTALYQVMAMVRCRVGPEVRLSHVAVPCGFQSDNPREANPASMNVEGLVPNFSRTVKFTQSALHRHTEVLTFPEMGEAGATK